MTPQADRGVNPCFKCGTEVSIPVNGITPQVLADIFGARLEVSETSREGEDVVDVRIEKDSERTSSLRYE